MAWGGRTSVPRATDLQRGGHLNPIFAVAGTWRGTGKREWTVRANIGVGRQKRAIGYVLGRKCAQTLAILPGLRNDQLDRSGVEANRNVIVILEIDIDGDDAGGVERILAEDFLLVALGAEIGVGHNGQVLMRVAGRQRHRVRRRALCLMRREGTASRLSELHGA